jgi:hypothetical protein
MTILLVALTNSQKSSLTNARWYARSRLLRMSSFSDKPD